MCLCVRARACLCAVIHPSGSQQGAGIPEVMACEASQVAQLLLNPAVEETDEALKGHSFIQSFIHFLTFTFS